MTDLRCMHIRHIPVARLAEAECGDPADQRGGRTQHKRVAGDPVALPRAHSNDGGPRQRKIDSGGTLYAYQRFIRSVVLIRLLRASQLFPRFHTAWTLLRRSAFAS